MVNDLKMPSHLKLIVIFVENHCHSNYHTHIEYILLLYQEQNVNIYHLSKNTYSHILKINKK